jgi:hypothetical protein
MQLLTGGLLARVQPKEPALDDVRNSLASGEAIAHLSAAETMLHQADMRLFAAAARRRRGELIGGSEGRALIADADAVMGAQAILCPDRMTAILSPERPCLPR